MSVNTSINLNDHFAQFLAAQVKTGRYGSASEVIREGLRLMEDRVTQMDALRAALVHGEASGPAEAFDFDEFLAGKNS